MDDTYGHIFVVFLFLLARYFSLGRKRKSLPPGPQGRFFAGVKSQLPTREPWKTYAEWGEIFSSKIISFRVYNKTVIILNDYISVQTLLDQRADLYSDRPFSWMFHVVCGRGKAVFNISSLDPRHRIYRRMLRSGLGARAIRDAWPSLKAQTSVLLDGFANEPEKWQQHVRRHAAAVIMKLAFGYTIDSLDDEFIELAEESSKISGWALAPGRWLVDYYPFIRYIPSYFPGTQWKKQGSVWREKLTYLTDVPHNWVKLQMAKGDCKESFTSRLMLSGSDKGGSNAMSTEEGDLVKWCAAGLYAGAADTTVSAITSFVLLMALHPEVQRKAQAELDSAFNGFSEVPDPDAIADLKYLNAVMREVLRYAPVGNLALPHCAIEEDEYMGYRIPKGATVMANVWAILHDPKLYPDPFVFFPDRFTDANWDGKQPDPRNFAFGFGRRVCPGSQFAETTMLLNMAGILARFRIECMNELGDKHRIVPEFTTGITSHIKPFSIRIISRILPDNQSGGKI